MSDAAVLYGGVAPIASFGLFYCCSLLFHVAKDWIRSHRSVFDDLCRWLVLAGHHLTGAF